ncbi:MAG: hydroxymethylglutaryl-CoA synthase [Holosporales bacterium]|nr:hydroxymethylglutaryl-CoA synthase [Holosporales bacterium]
MIPVGIDVMTFSTAHFVLDVEDLATARGVDFQKYRTGLGLEAMSVPSPQEDIITMGVEAGQRAMARVADPASIRFVLFATESSIDQSKSAGIYIHHFLGLPSSCRVIELKQACYGATAALQLAVAIIRQNPQERALIIASDVARYGLRTKGEPTQGCGAVALIVSAHPRLLQLEETSGTYTRHIMDFWRPNGQDEACVDGRYSTISYLDALEKSWKDFQSRGGVAFEEIACTCYHTPFPRMAEKASTRHAKLVGREKSLDPALLSAALRYNRQVGNCYTAALYVSLLSLLEQASHDFSDQRLGFFSYGSGCVAEFFTGIVPPGYQEVLFPEAHAHTLERRLPLTVPRYEEFYAQSLHPTFVPTPHYPMGPLCFLGIRDQQRHYSLMSSIAQKAS